MVFPSRQCLFRQARFELKIVFHHDVCKINTIDWYWKGLLGGNYQVRNKGSYIILGQETLPKRVSKQFSQYNRIHPRESKIITHSLTESRKNILPWKPSSPQGLESWDLLKTWLWYYFISFYSIYLLLSSSVLFSICCGTPGPKQCKM